MDREWFFNNLKKLLGALKRLSAGTVLLIWALTMIAGVFLYKILNRNKPGKEVSLNFATWWEDELEGEVISSLAAEYEALNPGITIRLEKKSWDEILELLEGKAVPENSRNAQKPGTPDIFSIDPYAIYELEKNSHLAALESGRDFSGNVVSIISFINPLYYNIELLEAAGFDRPPKNQTEFLSYVQRLRETGVHGMGLALSDSRSVSRQLLSWIWAATGNPASSPFNFTSKDAVDTLTFLNQLKQNLYANPFELSEAELLDAFGNGKIGMMIGSVKDVKDLKKTKINFSITTIPAPVSYTKRPVFPLTVWYAGVNSGTAFPEEAKDFVSYLKKKAGDIAAAAYAVPGSGMLNREQSRNDPYYAKAFDMYEAGEMIRELYNTPNIKELNSIILREVRLMFQGNKTPQECAEAMQREWENLVGTEVSVH